MDLWIAFAVATIGCITLMPILIKYADRMRLLDIPDARKIHQQAIPRCGGIAIAFGALLAIFSLLSTGSVAYPLLWGGLIIAVFGLADDIFNLNYKWKFFGQIIATIYVVSQGIYLHVLPFSGLEDAPVWLSYPLTVLFVIGVTNAVNLADGLDGLAAGVMLLTLAFIALFAVDADGADIALMALAIGGGLVGFLKFNTFPAIVFMGDLGSQFIGFMAAYLAILLTQNINQAMNSALPLLILGLPILDTVSVMAQRIRMGLSPFMPDKRHIHHKLIKYGLPHQYAVAAIYILQSLFLVAAAYLRYAQDWQLFGFYIVLFSSVLGGFFIADLKQWQLNDISVEQDRRSNQLLRKPWLFTFTRQYIELSVIVFLLFLSIATVYGVNISYKIELLILGFAILACHFLAYSVQDIIIRCSVYMGSMLIVYVQTLIPFDQFIIDQTTNAFFIILFLITWLAVRITRKSYFVFNTQDLLVFLFILVAVLLIQIEYLIRSILYLVCLGYALEYLLQRDIYKYKLLRILAFSGMLNILQLVWILN